MLLIKQQYPIEGLPKYNFSHAMVEDFTELCFSSFEKLFWQRVKSGFGEQKNGCLNDEAMCFEEISLQPLYENASVIAVDVSSMRVGETKEGILIAIRGAVVWNFQRKYKYMRLGPFLFHVTEENKNQLFNLLCKQHFPFAKVTAPDLLHVQTRIAAILEQWLQINLCVASSDSLILIDGSLVGGTPEAPEGIVSEILRAAKNKGNTILAFSKLSRLHFDGRCLTDVARKGTPPCLIKINGLEPCMGSFRLFGDIYVAKLSEGALSFRLDIDKELPQPLAENAVQRLLGNDVVYQGYPETLRLAHIYSIFTASEVIGMQRYLTQQCGLKILVKPNLRRVLFGPFGKGPEG